MTEKLETTLLTFCKQIKGELICMRDKKIVLENICVHPYLS